MGPPSYMCDRGSLPPPFSSHNSMRSPPPAFTTTLCFDNHLRSQPPAFTTTCVLTTTCIRAPPCPSLLASLLHQLFWQLTRTISSNSGLMYATSALPASYTAIARRSAWGIRSGASPPAAAAAAAAWPPAAVIAVVSPPSECASALVASIAE
eukprot:264313-Chlamydomonas_euryale.AAC.2